MMKSRETKNYSNVAYNEQEAERDIEQQTPEVQAGGGNATNVVDNNNNNRALDNINEHSFKEVMAGLLGAVSVGTSIAAMIMTSATTVTIAGIFACVIAPYSYWQQRNLTDILALKNTHTALVKEIARLTSENERLRALVDELGETVTKIEDVEETLDYIHEMNIESVAEFREQVSVGKNILGLMRENLKANALQNVITVVLNSDLDKNYRFDDEEFAELVDNLKAINGIELDVERFRERLRDSKHVDEIVQVLDELLVSDPRNKQSIIMYK